MDKGRTSGAQTVEMATTSVTRDKALVRSRQQAITAYFVAHPSPETVLVLSRNKNANVVLYNAVMHGSGRLDAGAPLVPQWAMLAEPDHHREGLNFLERTAAYGVNATVKAGGTEATVSLVAAPQHAFALRVSRGAPMLIGDILGARAYVTRIHVHDVASFLGLPTVPFVTLMGFDTATGRSLAQTIAT